jgi:hypothetical protein
VERRKVLMLLGDSIKGPNLQSAEREAAAAILLSQRSSSTFIGACCVLFCQIKYL